MTANPVAAKDVLPNGFPSTDRTKTSLNQTWRFYKGEPEAHFYRRDTDDSKWQSVNVPHSLALTSLTLDGMRDEKTQLKFHRDVGWYRRDFKVSQSKEKKIFLEFEGVHQVTDVWVNGEHVGQHAVGGYTPFHFDISSFVKRGANNQLTVRADNRRSDIIPPDPGPFDYVKFGGLYRDVYLVETHPVHITFNWEGIHSGVTITTPTIDPVNKNATVSIKTSVRNEQNTDVESEVLTRVIDRNNIVVLRLVDKQIIPQGDELQFNQIGSVEDDVRFWSIEDPYLYRVNTVVKIDGKPVDFAENKLGLRKFEHDPERGFLLNHKPIKLVGFNRHQQFPYVGDAVPDALHYKDMQQFKEFGFNVMRTAHYPQDDALMDACDELGILVYSEAPTWISVSQDAKWWENFNTSARVLVRNHRNHPSIVIWGAGVNHRGYVPSVHNLIKQEDPTRLTASQNSSWTGWQTSGITDINANMLYGSYIWDRSEPLLAMEGRRGPKGLAPYMRDPKLTGLISWTAHAYYTFHPRHDKADSDIDRTRSGMMTIFRYPRPQFEWYKAELLAEPFVFIQEHWKPGTDKITVFSNAEEVALMLNGREIARSKPSTNKDYLGLNHPPFHFDNIQYQRGSLAAKALFADGSTLESVKTTTEAAYALELDVDIDGREFVADGSDILQVFARIIDKNGMTVDDAPNLVTFTIKGDASIVGDGADINANPMFSEYGVAPALIRAGNTPGKITIYANSKGLKAAKATVTLSRHSTNVIAKNAEAIYDFNKERVDIGASDQLLQFGWRPWNGEDEADNRYQFKTFKGATAALETNSKNGVIRWLGEMNVIGKYGFAYGDGIIAIDDNGVDLVLNGLKKGVYKLTSWHHAPRSNSDSMDPNREKLKSLTIDKLPYEKQLSVSSRNLIGDKKVLTTVTEGKNMQSADPGLNVVRFKSNGKTPVRIKYQGKTKKGLWLNAFELSEWDAAK